MINCEGCLAVAPEGAKADAAPTTHFARIISTTPSSSTLFVRSRRIGDGLFHLLQPMMRELHLRDGLQRDLHPLLPLLRGIRRGHAESERRVGGGRLQRRRGVMPLENGLERPPFAVPGPLSTRASETSPCSSSVISTWTSPAIFCSIARSRIRQ